MLRVIEGGEPERRPWARVQDPRTTVCVTYGELFADLAGQVRRGEREQAARRLEELSLEAGNTPLPGCEDLVREDGDAL